MPWSKLLSDGLYRDELTVKYENRVDELNKIVRLRNNGGDGGLVLNTGILKNPDKPDNNTYLIDFDFYVDVRTEIDDADNTLEELHRLSGRAFRWAISDELHERLGPLTVPQGGVAPI